MSPSATCPSGHLMNFSACGFVSYLKPGLLNPQMKHMQHLLRLDSNTEVKLEKKNRGICQLMWETIQTDLKSIFMFE